MTEYDWDVDCLMTEQIARAKPGKKAANSIAPKLNELDMSGANYTRANFANLHKGAIYHGTMTTSHNAAKTFNLMSPSDQFRDFSKQ